MELKSERTLSTLLWGLSRKIVEKVKDSQAAGELVHTRTMYLKPKVDKFEYKEGGTSYQTSFNHVEKDEWHWKDQHEFIQKVIKLLPEYSVCISEIAKRRKVADAQAEFWLYRFVQFLVSDAVQPINEEFIVDKVTTFISDVDNSPVEWRCKVLVDGVWLEHEQCKLEESMVLRRPTPADIEEEKPIDFLPMYKISPHFEVSSAILEFSLRSKDSVEVQKEAELTLDVLRLFRLGSVHSERTEMSAKSFINSGLRASWGHPQSTNYKYSFKADDTAAFLSLTKKLRPILSSSYEQPKEGLDTLAIAFQRYKDALLQSGTIESRITSVITCLEALYLKAEERAELSHRLSQRVSALLRLLNFTPLEVYNNLSQAYEIRSTFIHGSQIEKDRQESATKLCGSIMEYARVSLLVFFQLKGTIEKEKMINRLDNSLLDDKAFQKAKELISGDIIITK